MSCDQSPPDEFHHIQCLFQESFLRGGGLGDRVIGVIFWVGLCMYFQALTYTQEIRKCQFSLQKKVAHSRLLLYYLIVHKVQ